MIRRLRCLTLPVLAALVLQGAPASAEPRPGTVVGLDLASPEQAAANFASAWAAGDYFVAWLALDPQLRSRFERMYMEFDFASIFPDAGFMNDSFDRFAALTAESADPEGTPGLLPDLFAVFGGSMQLARQADALPFRLDADAIAGGSATLETDGEPPLAHLPVSAEAGGGMLVLRRSPQGRWRVIGFEGRDIPALWSYPPQ